MKKLLIVTDIAFWLDGTGYRTRLSSMIGYLKNKLDITVTYAGSFDESDKDAVAASYNDINLVVLEDQWVTFREYAEKFEAYIQDKTFDAVLISYIRFFTMLPFIPGTPITFLDTNDILSDLIKSLKENKLPHRGINLTEEEEFRIFGMFHYVIAIQKNDQKKIGDRIGADRVLLVPHAISNRQRALRTPVKKLVYIASGYPPNADAIIWFIENVWTVVYTRFNLTLNIYGNVHALLPSDLETKKSGVRVHGFVEDLDQIYDHHCDIIINPVRAGAGLKIKNVEALSNGFPMITTSHGASGIEDGAGSAFLLADTSEEFISGITKLVTGDDFRKELAENAFRYAHENFSAEKCYGELYRIIQNS